MAVIQTGIFTVIKRFPGHKDAIRHLYRENDNFQIMCEDYRKCVDAHLYWNESGSKEASVRTMEYETLRGEIETDIIRSIAEANPI